MPQVLKEEIRAKILASALAVFAERGFADATMGAIGEHAGLGTASLYRYFSSKEALFDAAVPKEIAEGFAALLDRRVRALARGDADDLSEAMLAFWIEHRLAVVVLLDGAEGTPHEKYGRAFVAQLVRGTLSEVGGRVAAPSRFVVERVFEHTRMMLAAILMQHATEAQIRVAVRTFWSYQVAGLRALVAALSGSSEGLGSGSAGLKE